MLSQGFSQATTIVLGIILVRLISQQDLGTYRQVFLVYSFLAGIIAVQFDSSLYYFLPKNKPEKHREILFQCLLLSVLFAAVIALTMFLGSSVIARMMNNRELVTLLKIFSIYPFLERIVAILPAYLISTDRAVRAGIYTIMSTIGRVGVVVGGVFLGYTLPDIFWFILGFEAVLALVGCIDMLRLIPKGQWNISRRHIVEQLHYTWPLWATATIGVISVQLDKFLISFFFDPETYAIYSCGAFELPVIALVTASVSTAMMPNLVTLGDQGKYQEALELWHEGIRKCSLIIFPCFAFFIFSARDIMVLMYGSAYVLAAWPFAIYLLRLPLRVAVYATVFRALGKTRVIAISAIISLVTNVIFSVGLSVIGHKTFLTYIGPSIGAVISSFITAVYFCTQLSKLTEVQFSRVMRWKELGKVLSLSILCGLVMFLIPLSTLSLGAKIATQTIIFSLLLVLLMFLAKVLKKDEIELLSTPFWALKRKFFNR